MTSHLLPSHLLPNLRVTQPSRAQRPLERPSPGQASFGPSSLGQLPLGQLSLGNAPPRERGHAKREPAAASPRRVRGPIIAPDDPSLLNVPAAGPAASAKHDSRHPVHVEAPRLAPVDITGSTESRDPVARTIAKGRDGLIAGVSFLVNRDDAPEVPGEGIVLAGGPRLRTRAAHRAAGAAGRRCAGGRLAGAGAAGGRRRGAGQSGGAVQRQDHSASDRRRGRGDSGP